MPKPSTAQAKILNRIRAGARLSLNSSTGRYVFTEMNGSISQIDQRPVLTMIKNGMLHQALTGECRDASLLQSVERT